MTRTFRETATGPVSVRGSVAWLLAATLLLTGCVSTTNRPPEVISAGGIVYPDDAHQRRIEGFVKVAYDVTVDGTVTNARVVESDPPGLFDAAALAAVRSWRFHAAVRNGKLVPAQNVVSRVNFKLGESEAYVR
jgi:TonB family protein